MKAPRYSAIAMSLAEGEVPEHTPVSRRAAILTEPGTLPYEYETVAASATGQALGATGAAGDFLQRLIIVPATTSPGNVLLLDGAISITVFAGGASSVNELRPIVVEVGALSVSGAWSITTGANVSVIAIGNFT